MEGYSICRMQADQSDDDELDFETAKDLLSAVGRVFGLDHAPRVDPPVSA